VEPGKFLIVRGVAWSGDQGPVAAVDVSIDGGRTWKPARLSGEATPFGWRLWEYPWTPEDDGQHTLLARARDSSGNIQPMVSQWNPSGYLWNAVARVELNTLESRAVPPSETLPPPVFREACLTCHEDDVVRQQRLTRAQWDRVLNKMIGWGARVRPDDRESLLDYLTRDPR
jgi:hypothetical protein